VPALVIKRVAYTYNDTPVEYRVSWVNTENHEYLSDLWKNETK
jgi:GntR family transcriptional regulator